MEITEEQLEKLKEMVKKSHAVSCDEITNQEYWNEEWTECPICGCKPDEDGVWVHGNIQ